jgi:hypothetical protein
MDYVDQYYTDTTGGLHFLSAQDQVNAKMQGLPLPDVSWATVSVSQAQAIQAQALIENMPPPKTSISFLQFMELFTQAEQVAAIGSTDVNIKIFIMKGAGAGLLDLNNPEVIAGVNYLVSIGILTQARATAILANQPYS